MALPTSGTLSLARIGQELGRTTAVSTSLGDTAVRSLKPNSIKLLASDGAYNDKFGSVSISSDGNTAAVGAYNKNTIAGGSQAGSVYIFIKSGDTWSQQAKLTASDAAPSDFFGSSVALSSDGNTLAVGAPGDNNSLGSDSGSVYVFTRSGTTWVQQQRLQASTGLNWASTVGSSVAISSDGNTICAGGPAADIGGFINSGQAYIFTRSAGVWSEQAALTPSTPSASLSFSWSVALSFDGNTAAIGAPSDDIAGQNSGAVYVFTRSGTTWTQQARLQGGDSTTSDQLGRSVTLSSDGNTLATGAIYDDHSNVVNPGSVYVFTRSGTAWTQQQRVQATDAAGEDVFGWSVALAGTGNILVVGSPTKRVSPNPSSGSVYIFNRSGSTWSQQTRLEPSDGNNLDRFGDTAAISNTGSTILVGSTDDTTSVAGRSGSAYVFSYPVQVSISIGDLYNMGLRADSASSGRGIYALKSGFMVSTSTVTVAITPNGFIECTEGSFTDTGQLVDRWFSSNILGVGTGYEARVYISNVDASYLPDVSWFIFGGAMNQPAVGQYSSWVSLDTTKYITLDVYSAGGSGTNCTMTGTLYIRNKLTLEEISIPFNLLAEAYGD